MATKDRVIMINSEYAKRYTAMDNNVSNEVITPFIFKSQQLHIQSDLGSKLFKSILNKIKTQTIKDVGNEAYNDLLVDYIRPSLAEWVLFEVLPFISNKVTNKSVSQLSSANSTPSDLDEVKWLRNSVRDSAEFYSKLTINYLKENCDLFDELTDPTDCTTIKPSSSSFFNGIKL